MDKTIEDRFGLIQSWESKIQEWTLPLFESQGFEVIEKGDGSPVTEVDRAVERQLREEIESNFPEDGIVGEEYGEKRGSGEFIWYLDPIDGTKSFVSGAPLFGTMIGVTRDGQPTLGCVQLPALREVYWGIRGQGAFCKLPKSSESIPLKSTQSKSLAESAFCYSGREMYQSQRGKRLFEMLESRTSFNRSWGDAFGFSLLAKGSIDLIVDPVLHAWDVIPWWTILDEAGLKIFDLEGETNPHSLSMVACNPGIEDEVKAILLESREEIV